MTHPKDTDEHADSRPDDAELMLVDLLYGELDEDGEAQARERVRERALDGELAGLEQLRAMLAELPEEEPPAAISAKLMHAAATHAPGAAARKSARSDTAAEGEKKGILAWLGSLIRPIAMYPGLAAATTLVLVVGVAGTLYLSGRDQFAEPRLSVPEAEVPSGEVAMPEAIRAEAEQVMQGADEAAEGSEWAQAEQEPAEAATGGEGGASPGDMKMEQKKPAEEAERRSRSSASSAASKASGRKARAYDGEDLDQAVGGVVSGSAGAGTGAGYGKGAANAPRAAAPATSTAPARDSLSLEDEAPAADMDGESDDDGRYQAPARPAPRQRAEPSRDDSADAIADKPKKKAPVSKADSDRVRSLHDEARAAAANGQCDVVRKVSEMIRKLDARYHRDTYSRDKLLAACLGKSKK